MSRATQEERRERRERVLQKIYREPGIRTTDLSTALQINDRTLRDDLKDLEGQGKIYPERYGWYPTEQRPSRLRPLELEPEEGLMLYLAIRLFIKTQDRQNPIAEQMLYKLAQALVEDIGIRNDILDAAEELIQREPDMEQSRKLRSLIQAYLYRRRVRVVYHPLHERPFETELEIYLIEPFALGMTFHIVAFNVRSGAMRQYKLERFASVDLLSQEYQIPDTFKGLDYMRYAALIIGGEEVTEVKLRFSSRVATRLQENQWFSTSELSYDGNAVLLTLRVNSLIDLAPWIRSWGADCEVISPEKLRNMMIGETRALAKLYGVTSVSNGVDRTVFDDMFGG